MISLQRRPAALPDKVDKQGCIEYLPNVTMIGLGDRFSAEVWMIIILGLASLSADEIEDEEEGEIDFDII